MENKKQHIASLIPVRGDAQAHVLVFHLIEHHLSSAKEHRDSIPFQSYRSGIEEAESLAEQHEYEAAYVVEAAKRIKILGWVDVESRLKKYGYQESDFADHVKEINT